MLTENEVTPAQWESLNKLFTRQSESPSAKTREQFFSGAIQDRLMGCVMVPAMGMWFGIETDGYTHT
jgi:hypothetical protein